MPKKSLFFFFLSCIWIFNLSMMVSSCSSSPAFAIAKDCFFGRCTPNNIIVLYFLSFLGTYGVSIINHYVLFVSNQLLHFVNFVGMQTIGSNGTHDWFYFSESMLILPTEPSCLLQSKPFILLIP